MSPLGTSTTRAPLQRASKSRAARATASSAMNCSCTSSVSIKSSPRSSSCLLHAGKSGGPWRRAAPPCGWACPQDGRPASVPGLPGLCRPRPRSEQLPGKMLEGIDAVVFLGKTDAGQALPCARPRRCNRHFAAHPDETALGLGKLVIELLRFDAEDGPQGVGHGQEILDLLRPGIDGTGLHAAGQHLPVVSMIMPRLPVTSLPWPYAGGGPCRPGAGPRSSADTRHGPTGPATGRRRWPRQRRCGPCPSPPCRPSSGPCSWAQQKHAGPHRCVRYAMRYGLTTFLSPVSDENLNMRPPLVMLAG